MGLLAGCSLSFDQMLPALTGTDPAEVTSSASKPVKTKPVPTAPVQVVKTIKPSQPPPMGTSKFEPKSITAGENTGTFVGQKAIELRNELAICKQVSQKITINFRPSAIKLFKTPSGITARSQPLMRACR